jgi:adenosylcobyric acid synthase
MLGRTVADPGGIEGAAGTAPGLGLLDVETMLTSQKVLRSVTGAELRSGADIAGYEMHVGRTDGPGAARPMLRLGTRPDGAVSADGRIMGCHVHGIFAGDAFRRAFLERLGGSADATLAFEARVESALDALADHCEAHLDVAGLLEIARAR